MKWISILLLSCLQKNGGIELRSLILPSQTQAKGLWSVSRSISLMALKTEVFGNIFDNTLWGSLGT